MQVCVIGTRGFPSIQGGVEHHCESIYPRIARVANVVVFRRKPYVASDETYDGIRFIDLPSTKIKGLEAIIHSFIASVRALMMRPDVIHYHNIGPALFSPLPRLFSIPVVLTFHSANYEHAKWGGIAKRLLRVSEKIALKNADAIIFLNDYQRDRYDSHVLGKSVVIPNGVDAPIRTDRTDYLESLGLEPGKYILSVGRITPEKDFGFLIKAFQLSGVQGFKLVIAGGGERSSKYVDELERLAADSSTGIVFTGAVYGEELAQLYENAAIFVLSSSTEGFPLVVLEAMSYGVEVLVSDIPATRLFNLDDEDYFGKESHLELAEKLASRMNMVVKRSYNLSDYDWDEIAHSTLSVYAAVSTEQDLLC